MSHINMGGMNGTTASMAQMPMLNGATPGRVDDQEHSDYPARLNAYIYDYFLGQGMWDCARALAKHRDNMEPPPSDDQVNGTDSKDSLDSKKPMDLPSIQVGVSQPGAFLLEWFDLFWDIFQAQRSKPKGGPQTNAQRYMEYNTTAQKFRQESQAAMLRQGPMNPMEYQQMLRPNGMQTNGDLRKQIMQAKGMNMSMTPQQMAQYTMNNQAMRRDPSAMDMDGQRPRTPSSGDNAPSPSKRPRLEGGPPGFNGRGGMPPHIMMDARTARQNMLKNGMDPGQLGADYQNMSMHQTMMNPGMRGQGSPMMQNGMDFRNNGFVGDGPLGTIGAGGPNGNHALQDYQMQLMLLEQQNKKRLLMARQEQNTENRPDGPGGPGYPSPNGSRSGPSPGPSEQMGKRGSPQMGSGAMPQSPLHNGVMPHDRASPNSMNYMGQQMPQEMLQPKMENGMPPMGPGSAMARGPQGQYTTQAAEMQARMRGHMPNGPNMFQAQQPPQAPMMQQSQSQQPAQMGTPQPRNNNMPPPQNPAVANANNRRTASPAPSAAPPTPQQTNKAAPKKKKAAENKSKPTKKGSTAGAPAQTPSAETDAQPPTPTPATPTISQHPSSFSGAKNEAPAPAPVANAVPPAAPQNIPGPMDGLNFDTLGPLDGTGYPMEYNNIGDTDIISTDFNFDSFLTNDADDYGMDTINFGSSMITDGGVEAAGVDNP